MTFDEWWEDFVAGHDEWKYADSEALRRAAFQAGAASRDAEVAELVAALEDCNRYAKVTLPTGYLALFTSQVLAKVRKP